MPKLRSALAAAGVVAAAVAGGTGALGAVRAESISGDYREVLGRLAEGDVERALDDLAGLEMGVLGEYPSRRLIESLWTVKLRVIRDLIQAESLDVLVPIIVFHHEAAAGYRERQAPALAMHSRQMVDELADFYATRAGDARADIFSAWVLASLGAYAQESRSFSFSRLLFERALALDPSNEFALLALGVTLEMHGLYAEATPHFERLVRLAPDHAEARLRLALCRLRGGQADRVGYRAVDEIEQVAVEPEAPDWVRSLAFQELAALHMREGRRQEAEEALRRGLEALPADPTQRIQLAALLERRGSRRQALDLLRGIEAAPGGDSPRRHYDRLPTAGLDAGRATMRRMMTNRLRLLSAGLELAEGSTRTGGGEEVGE